MLLFALSFPIVVFSAGGALDYSFMISQKRQLQATADSAAIVAAKEYTIATTEEQRFEAVVRSFVSANLQDGNVQVSTEMSTDPFKVTVKLEQNTEPFFLKEFFPSKLSVSATAQLMNGTPLCVLGLGDDFGGTLTMEENAKLTGNGCAVYSNSTKTNGLVSKQGAMLEADLICSSGGWEGSLLNFLKEPITDCPPMEDPLASRAAPMVGPCDQTDMIVGDVDEKSTGLIGNAFSLFSEIKDEKDEGTEAASAPSSKSSEPSQNVTLSPGTYCGGILIGGNVSVEFLPGIYIMKDGPLHVSNGAAVKGEGVGFYLTGFESVFFFGADTSVSLSAPTSGDLAGLLFFEDRDSFKLRQFTMLSDDARTLVGTIYLPKAFLFVDADRPIADLSAYTAIIVNRMSLFAGPHLVLNTDYGATNVPVPSGIAGVDAKAFLSK